MTQQIYRLDQILSAQELITANSLHFPIKFMNKHMGFGRATSLAPRQHGGCKNCRHSSRRSSEVASGTVHQNYIPTHFVDVIWEIVDAQFTVREEQVLHWTTLVSELFPSVVDEVVEIAHSGCELNIVGFDFWVFLFELGNHVSALVDEHCSAAVVERVPEEGFVG